MFDEKAYRVLYREKNRERLKAYNKAYNEQNRARVAAVKAAYHEKNKEKLNRQSAERYQRNREQIRAREEARYLANPEKKKTHQAAYYRQNKARYAANRKQYHLQRQYGLSVDAYQAMAAEQGYVCKICGSKPKRLFVDHCHSTGGIRDLLCQNCNTMLGAAKDKPDVLRAAADYLERHTKP